MSKPMVTPSEAETMAREAAQDRQDWGCGAKSDPDGPLTHREEIAPSRAILVGPRAVAETATSAPDGSKWPAMRPANDQPDRGARVLVLYASRAGFDLARWDGDRWQTRHGPYLVEELDGWWPLPDAGGAR